jgi:hypothetical protein
MPSTKVGTIISGNSKEIYLKARAEKCFPDLPEEKALRWTQSTNLPNQYKKMEFDFNTDINPIFQNGNETVKFKAGAKGVKSVEIELTGASVEMLQEMNFYDYYIGDMTANCRTYLQKFPFIVQNLRIESMNITFKDEYGGNIDLTAKLPEVVELSASTKWSIVNNSTLKIETPKYIGYKLARINQGDEGFSYSNTVDSKGDWIFHKVNFLSEELNLNLSETLPDSDNF